MNPGLFKNKLIMFIVFTLTFIIYLFFSIMESTGYFRYSDKMIQRITDEFFHPNSILILSFLTFSFIIFVFLFRYQSEEIEYRYILKKLSIISIISGVVWSLFALSTPCSGESCLGVAYSVLTYPPLAISFLLIFSLIMSLNHKYKTNLFIVICAPVVFVVYISIAESWLTIPCSFLIGTVAAIFFKKFPDPVTFKSFLLTFLILFTPWIPVNIVNFFMNRDRLGNGFDFGIEMNLAIMLTVSLVLGIFASIISLIYIKIKNRRSEIAI